MAVAFACASCATSSTTLSAVEEYDPSGRRRDREPAVEVIVTDAGAAATVSSPWLPGMRITGLVEQTADGGLEVYVTGARLFANWANGWTEARYEASGVLVLVPVEGAGGRDGGGDGGGTAARRVRLTVREPVELWTLERGEIRYYDTYVRGDDGVSRVRARVDRLTAVAEWLLDQGGAGSPPGLLAPGRASTDYGAAVSDRVWGLVEGARGEPADGLPEWLGELYGSRSLHRDLREASDLLVTLANLHTINEGFLDGTLVEER